MFALRQKLPRFRLHYHPATVKPESLFIQRNHVGGRGGAGFNGIIEEGSDVYGHGSVYHKRKRGKTEYRRQKTEDRRQKAEGAFCYLASEDILSPGFLILSSSQEPTMRAMQIEGGFGLDALKPVELPEPTPGPGRFWCAFMPHP